MQYHLRSVGAVSAEELVARVAAYLNAGAPEPVLDGTPDEKRAALDWLAATGDGQTRSFVEDYRRRLADSIRFMQGRTG